MKNNDLLDDKDDDNLILGIVQWWEQRRLRYNLIVGGVGILLTFLLSYLINFLRFLEPMLIALFFQGVYINIAYLLAWVLEIVLYYYFNITLSEQRRNVLYWGGVVIAVLSILGLLIEASKIVI